MIPGHPNEDGAWTRLEGLDGVALWRRDRADRPVSMYYVVQPPGQAEIFYDEAQARARFDLRRPQEATADPLQGTGAD